MRALPKRDGLRFGVVHSLATPAVCVCVAVGVEVSVSVVAPESSFAFGGVPRGANNVAGAGGRGGAGAGTRKPVCVVGVDPSPSFDVSQ